jgi:hypothetical protein
VLAQFGPIWGLRGGRLEQRFEIDDALRAAASPAAAACG